MVLKKARGRHAFLHVLGFISFLSMGLGSVGCQSDSREDLRHQKPEKVSDLFLQSSPGANFVASAVRAQLDVDVVLLPSSGFSAPAAESFGTKLLATSPSDEQVLELVAAPEPLAIDELVVGTMRGDKIREFILWRSIEMQRCDLQVAGLRYDLSLHGGQAQAFFMVHEDGSAWDDQRMYRVALAYGPYRRQFPGYYYRHGLSRSFQEEQRRYALQDVVRSYMADAKPLQEIESLRARVRIQPAGRIDELLPIHRIQGVAHISPFIGQSVLTEGVVTAIAETNDPRDPIGFFLQAPMTDDDPRTSEALQVQTQEKLDLAIGDHIRLRGVVYETLTAQGRGLSATILRDVTELEVLARNQSLPAPIQLGGPRPERVIPEQNFALYNGDLNRKPHLNLKDGIDFWESLEGMRISLSRPEIVGISGGQKDAHSSKSHLNLFVVAEQAFTPKQRTPAGGILLDVLDQDFNPEIIQIIDHPMSQAHPRATFNVGDRFPENLQGIMAFNTNLFGDGQFVMLVEKGFQSTSEEIPVEQRPQTRLRPENGRLTVASFNVENLFAAQTGRMDDLAFSLAHHLQCPDIVGLVEIQDNNGALFEGGADADDTLSALIEKIDCHGQAAYQAVHVNPMNHQEGGEPGGNIRVAMIYNSKRVQFEGYGYPQPDQSVQLMTGGRLSTNPGRLFARDPRFDGVRRSLVAEFQFAGRSVFVLVNHFNSKGGDDSVWARIQPPVRHTESKRIPIAAAINQFVQTLSQTRPDAGVIVMGDFNDFHDSRALKVLAGKHLGNLMTHVDAQGKPLVAPADRYTYNFMGNSQTLDGILANPFLLARNPEMEVLHINTDYLGQLSDHDPLVARFTF